MHRCGGHWMMSGTVTTWTLRCCMHRSRARLFQAVAGIRDGHVTGVQTCALPILSTVLEPLENRSTIEVEVSPAPLGELYAKKFIVSGTVQRESYHQWLKQEALDRDLNGYIKKMFRGEIEIVVAGTNKEDISAFKELISLDEKKAKVNKIKEENFDAPIKVGFEINERYRTNSLRSVETTIKKMDRDLRDMHKEVYQTEKENRYIKESNSWRYTMPIRKVGDFVKKFKGSKV